MPGLRYNYDEVSGGSQESLITASGHPNIPPDNFCPAVLFLAIFKEKPGFFRQRNRVSSEAYGLEGVVAGVDL